MILFGDFHQVILISGTGNSCETEGDDEHYVPDFQHLSGKPKHFQDSLMTRKMIKEQLRWAILSEQQGAESSSDALWGVTNSGKGSRMKRKRENVIFSCPSYENFVSKTFAFLSGVKDESRSSECLRPCTHPPQHPGYGSEQFGYPCFLPQHTAPPPTRFSPPRDAPFFNFSQQPFRWVDGKGRVAELR